MKNLLIIGARAFGREIYNIALQTKEYNNEWVIKGFLDDDRTVMNEFSSNYSPIIDSVKNYKIQPNDVFICALGDPKIKKQYIQEILLKGGKFINIIHPSAVINPINVSLGTGVIICPFTYISNDTTIGNFVTIQTHVALGHDVIVGDYCQINALSFLGGYAKVGTETLINPSANILPKKSIGNNSSIGVNSSLLNNIGDNISVYGNPAKRIL
jgi:sugar O-acyltransferase (sialic acid O-acetyltransferase NeuD family)